MRHSYGQPFGSGCSIHSAAEAAEITRRDQCMREDAVGVLFRVEANSYAYIVDAEHDEWGSTALRLELFALEVQRWTTHGATLFEHSWSKPKWVDLREGNQYASRTAQEALQQFQRRRLRQIWILEKQLSRARSELSLANTSGALSV